MAYEAALMRMSPSPNKESAPMLVRSMINIEAPTRPSSNPIDCVQRNFSRSRKAASPVIKSGVLSIRRAAWIVEVIVSPLMNKVWFRKMPVNPLSANRDQSCFRIGFSSLDRATNAIIQKMIKLPPTRNKFTP